MKGKLNYGKNLDSLFYVLDGLASRFSMTFMASIFVFIVEHLQLLSFVVCDEV